MTTDPTTGGPATAGPATGGPATGGSAATVVVAPPADVGVQAMVPVTVSAEVALVAPVGVAVPSVRPAFTVAVDSDTPGQQIEIQYDTAFGFTVAPVSVFVDAPAGMAGAQVAARSVGDLPDGQVWWRARVTGPYGHGDWTGAAVFAVNALEGQAVAAGSLTVSAAARAAPHLWYVDVAATGTDVGAAAVLIGTGFGAAPRVMLGTLDCPVLQSVTVPAGYPDPDLEPVIEPGVRCDPWHQQVTFTVPDVDPDHVGDVVTVLGDD